MKSETRSLMLLTAVCTFAGALFGFGSNVYSFKSGYEGLGREQLIQLASTLVYLALALILVFKGGWRGVLAANVMVVVATAIVWALLPASLSWAAVADPAGYVERFGGLSWPSYLDWATFDIVGVGVSAAVAQGLRLMAHVNPRGPQDE